MLALGNCPWCDGIGTTSKGTCPACGGEKLVTQRVSKAIKGLQDECNHFRKEPSKFALEVIAGMRKADKERLALAELPVPASFTKDKPDTPESQAALVQFLQSQKGMDIVEARRKVYGQ
jgi:hypothetical protein